MAMSSYAGPTTTIAGLDDNPNDGVGGLTADELKAKFDYDFSTFVVWLNGTHKTEFDLLAPLASPTFTGTPAAPTASAGTNTTQLATTAFVAAEAQKTRIRGYMEV